MIKLPSIEEKTSALFGTGTSDSRHFITIPNQNTYVDLNHVRMIETFYAKLDNGENDVHMVCLYLDSCDRAYAPINSEILDKFPELEEQ